VLAAMRLLRDSDLAVNQVARSCGFVDASSLAAHFRKRTGTSPIAYRRRE
jgi:transcriptional regulator GlxA family with amidase domain